MALSCLPFSINLLFLQRNSEKILKLIDEVYRWLPLGSVIDNRVLVVHGGISDTTNLDVIRSLDRGKVSEDVKNNTREHSRASYAELHTTSLS